jgi:hypothetical protein
MRRQVLPWPRRQVNRVSIGSRARNPAGPDAPVRSGDIFYDDGLSKSAPHRFGHNPPEHISRAARSVWNDHGDGPCWVGLCPCNVRDGRKRNSTRCKMQKTSSVGKSHCAPLDDLVMEFLGPFAKLHRFLMFAEGLTAPLDPLRAPLTVCGQPPRFENCQSG